MVACQDGPPEVSCLLGGRGWRFTLSEGASEAVSSLLGHIEVAQDQSAGFLYFFSKKKFSIDLSLWALSK